MYREIFFASNFFRQHFEKVIRPVHEFDNHTIKYDYQFNRFYVYKEILGVDYQVGVIGIEVVFDGDSSDSVHHDEIMISIKSINGDMDQECKRLVDAAIFILGHYFTLRIRYIESAGMLAALLKEDFYLVEQPHGRSYMRRGYIK